MVYNIFGNEKIINNYKIAFFCSKICPPGLITKIYDYAIKLKNENKTVISGFHTPIEKDVLKFLLKGKQPIIISPARNIENMRIPTNLKKAFKENRILFISTFKKNQKRITAELSFKRNLFICEIADEVFIAHASKNGKLEELAVKLLAKNKKVKTFNCKENENLLNLGATGI